MKPTALIIDLLLTAWLVAGFYHQTAAAAAEIFFTAFNIVAMLAMFLSTQLRAKLAAEKPVGKFISIAFDLLFCVLLFAHDWLAASTLQAIITVLVLGAYSPDDKAV